MHYCFFGSNWDKINGHSSCDEKREKIFISVVNPPAFVLPPLLQFLVPPFTKLKDNFFNIDQVSLRCKLSKAKKFIFIIIDNTIILILLSLIFVALLVLVLAMSLELALAVVKY